MRETSALMKGSLSRTRQRLVIPPLVGEQSTDQTDMAMVRTPPDA